MSTLKPKYITFDCYGTLIKMEFAIMARKMFQDRISSEKMEAFVKDFYKYRLDEVLNPWQPYDVVLKNSLERTCKRWGLAFHEEEGQAFYEAVPTWGPHPDVTSGLARLAKEFPLVIYSNAADEQIMSNVEQLGAPFHRVFTAEEAKVYKPRLAAFEYMLDNLGCNPEDILHVSSSFRYDLFPADDMGIKNKAFIARGHDAPANSSYSYNQLTDINALADFLGLE
ncbi:haloacid dehalogenase type II [Vibrio viridaestus]|uniref:Haloacid dehalogenase type II n=1 Tax=Vibrio viridaestus TaxID=2487322 RepID=A0A3N9TDU6_9VIBR|nr:haloacid dehalogenase type II [Vibrio viridaestus]RQW61873.1 haloacid dehalogenase type II [Vibrio viridaestus]